MIADRFAEDGFVVLEDVFPESEIRSISSEVDRILQGRAEYLPPHEIVYEPNTDPPRVRNAFRMHLYNEFFLDLAKTSRLTSVMEELLGRPLHRESLSNRESKRNE